MTDPGTNVAPPPNIVPEINTVTFDTTDPERLALFWTELLGVEIRHRIESHFIWLTSQREGGVCLAFQHVSDPTPDKNRLHLDSACRDLRALRERVIALGGSFVETHEVPGFVWDIFADPDGNVFCAGHPSG